MTERVAKIRDERRISEIPKVLPVRIDFRNQMIPHVDLDVLAIRANHGDVKALIAIAARPIERRFQYYLFFWIALRFVKTGSGFRNTKDIRDPVIADTIA